MPEIITSSTLKLKEGGILPKAVEGGKYTVSWTFPLKHIEGLTVQVESERLNYPRLLSLLVAVLVILAAAAYVLRPLWRFIRRKLQERAAISPEERERRKQEQKRKGAATDARKSGAKRLPTMP